MIGGFLSKRMSSLKRNVPELGGFMPGIHKTMEANTLSVLVD